MDIHKGNSVLRVLRYAVRHSVFLFGVAAVAAGIYGYNQLKSSHYFPIKTVRVAGVRHLDKNELKQTIAPLVECGFFSVNIEYIRDRLEQMPWVADSTVRRIWPDMIFISVSERKAAARWNKGSLLSSDGDLFDPEETTYPSSLVDFVGPSGMHITMLKYFVNINRILNPLHVKISYLELTPYYTWKVKLDNGLQLKLGNSDILTRLNHFVKVYSRIIGDRAGDVEYVDLRYSNGMAVKWKA